MIRAYQNQNVRCIFLLGFPILFHVFRRLQGPWVLYLTRGPELGKYQNFQVIGLTFYYRESKRIILNVFSKYYIFNPLSAECYLTSKI